MRSATSWLLALTLGFPVPAWADDLTPVKRADITKFITMTSGPALATQMADATTQNMARLLKSSRPDIPERYFAVLNGELRTLFQERIDIPGGLIDRMVPVYHRHFTHPEITQLIAFYESPAGRRMIDALARTVGEGVAVGQAWGESLKPEIQKRMEAALKKEGLETPRRK